MVAASYGGGQGQVMLTDGCFSRPGIPPSSPAHHAPPPHLQQMLYRQPYSIPLSDEMQHLVQEPKFPPQTFEIPDIQDSNSVFGDGAFDGTAGFGAYPGVTTLVGAPGIDRQSFFYGSPVHPDHSHCRPAGLSFPGAWQQQTPGVVSSAGSTNSSPVSQVEDATPSTVAEVGGSSVQTQQQVTTGLSLGMDVAPHRGVIAASLTRIVSQLRSQALPYDSHHAQSAPVH